LAQHFEPISTGGKMTVTKAYAYIPGENPDVFEVGKEFWRRKGTLVKNITTANSKLYIYFEDDSYIFFNHIPFGVHGKLESNQGGF